MIDLLVLTTLLVLGGVFAGGSSKPKPIQTTDAYEQALHREVADCYADPLRFVLTMFPWGKPGTMLEHFDGPDAWQWDFLEWLGAEVRERGFDGHTAVLPIRRGVSSGHGTGKTALIAMILIWAMATRPGMRGTVSANTMTQLDTKTWAGLRTWLKLAKVAHWFDINSDVMWRRGRREDWFTAKQSSNDTNFEAFQGQHAVTSSSVYIFDEASGIPDKIHEAAEGGLTDGQPMIFKFGQCTRSYGQFYVECFGKQRHRWTPLRLDSRECRFANKELITQYGEDYGLDSDMFRVRVLGMPPRASDLQFIPQDYVDRAKRNEPVLLGDEPLVCGLDVARGGEDKTVFRFRRGRDARSLPAIRIPGEQTRDSMNVVAKAVEILDSRYGPKGQERQVEMLFVDGTGIGGPICDRLKQLGYEDRIMEVQFGGESPKPKYANMRAYIWSEMKAWLPGGAIDTDAHLETDLVGPGYGHNKADAVLLESKEQMKKRQVASPDDADALALTFAYAVVSRIRATETKKKRERFEGRNTSRGGGVPWMNQPCISNALRRSSRRVPSVSGCRVSTSCEPIRRIARPRTRSARSIGCATTATSAIDVSRNSTGQCRLVESWARLSGHASRVS